MKQKKKNNKSSKKNKQELRWARASISITLQMSTEQIGVEKRPGSITEVFSPKSGIAKLKKAR